jgi:hypothetical protein
MIITNDFILLNLPKTGSTFTRNILKRIYYGRENFFQKVCRKFHLIKPEMKELIVPNLRMPNCKPDQHGTYQQIPGKYLNRTVVSIVRNPYDRFISIYRFKSWTNAEQLISEIEEINKNFPEFPNLNIDEYVDLNLLGEKTKIGMFEGYDKSNPKEIGNQTMQFIQMFFKNPKNVMLKLDDEYINSGRYKSDMAQIKFLKQEKLNEELYNFLSYYNFKESELETISNTKKLNVSKSFNDDNLWTKKAIEYVRYRERYLFLILDDQGIHYECPI